MARKRKPQDHTQDRIAKDTEAIEFIKLNAPYLTLYAMRSALQVSQEKMEALIKASGVEAGEAAREPRADDIADDLKFLPIGTVVEQLRHGTPSPLG